jgi:hypothetical protein
MFALQMSMYCTYMLDGYAFVVNMIIVLTLNWYFINFYLSPHLKCMSHQNVVVHHFLTHHLHSIIRF